MKAAPFEYHRPESVAEVLELLDSLDDLKLLAGGQSLMPMMNFRYLTPANVVDINRVAEISGIALSGAWLHIGATTRQRELARSSLIREHAPLMVDALAHVGHVQTRNRGTLGGSLCHLDPAAELPGVMLALDAELDVCSSRGARTIPMSDWCTGYMTPALEDGELLRAIRVPLSPQPLRHGFAELARRHGDFAIAGAAVTLALTNGIVNAARIVVIGADDGPRRLGAAEAVLEDAPPTAAVIEQAADAALRLAGIDDVHASAHYRRRIARVMVRRALMQAAESAVHRRR